MKTSYEVAGTVYIGPTPPPDRMGWPRPFAALCPVCGEVWARRYTPSVQGVRIPWMAFTATCPKCPPGFAQIPGSLWTFLSTPERDCLPDELLAREFTVHLNHYEKA